MFYSFDLQETDCGRFILSIHNHGDGERTIKVVHSLTFASHLIREILEKADKQWLLLHLEKEKRIPF